MITINKTTQHDGYTMTDAGTVVLGKSTFRVEVQVLDSGSVTTWLHGTRGAAYTLVPVSLMNDTGIYRVISWNSGAPFRFRGNEVRVIMLGDQIEAL